LIGSRDAEAAAPPDRRIFKMTRVRLQQLFGRLERKEITYTEELNIFGTSTGVTERVAKGGRQPLAPQGYTWRTVPWTAGPQSVVTK
jgi:hypothetical protein